MKESIIDQWFNRKIIRILSNVAYNVSAKVVFGLYAFLSLPFHPLG